VVSLTADCDGDALVARVRPAGPACHTGARPCFGESAPGGALAAFDETIARRSLSKSGGPPPNDEGTSAPSALHHHSAAPDNEPSRPSYTQRLLADRNLRLKKLTEEAGELAVACADGDRTRAIEEAADLLYHTLVALRALGASLDDVTRTLDERSSR
jgi:phosphoribosyl-ATP pyrophosphohydrolase/phosphoribosyl-AMP cyclohydrolase